MGNRKFIFLLNDFASLTQGYHFDIKVGQSILCCYDDMDCYIEDGSLVHLYEQIIILIPMAVMISSEMQVSFNSDFKLTMDGYFANIKDKGCCYIRHFPLPEQPRMLLRFLNETATIAKRLKQEIIQCG